MILVNQRLSGDESEDPNFPKIQFPSAEQCSKCHRITDQEFDESEVAKFLLDRSSVDNLILPDGEEHTFEVDEPEGQIQSEKR